jgi:hypothetical protein
MFNSPRAASKIVVTSLSFRPNPAQVQLPQHKLKEGRLEIQGQGDELLRGAACQFPGGECHTSLGNTH